MEQHRAYNQGPELLALTGLSYNQVSEFHQNRYSGTLATKLPVRLDDNTRHAIDQPVWRDSASEPLIYVGRPVSY